jgi:tripartite ATP-independent transporter DctP family solute receptor
MKLASLSVACALLAGALGSITTFPAQAETYKSEYKLSTVLGKPFPWGVGSERWAELITERTHGRITVRVFPGVSLVGGNQYSEFTALRQGAIDLSVSGTNNWSGQIKQLSLFALPFLLPDAEAQDRLTGGEVGAELFRLIESKGVVPLAWGDNGFRQLSNGKRPVRSPADLKGLKIRSVGSPIMLDIFNALGANPTQMSWADAQPALATGAVDGQELPVSIYYHSKMQTIGQKYFTRWNYIGSALIFAVNRDVWKGWSEADREIVRQAAIDAAKENIALARQDDALLKELETQGVEVVRPTAEEFKAFRQAAQPVYDKWTPSIGADLLKKAEAAVAGP